MICYEDGTSKVDLSDFLA